jgi:hypothetical protein
MLVQSSGFNYYATGGGKESLSSNYMLVHIKFNSYEKGNFILQHHICLHEWVSNLEL